jgi:type II secretory pathway pseudopilin PulG
LRRAGRPGIIAGVRRVAFTLLEVLIALVVLVLGILGVAAIIPQSVRTAGDTVDALALSDQARSVVAALKLGARERCHEVWTGAGPTRRLVHAFLVLPHPDAGSPPAVTVRADGSVDPAIFGHEACILLPTGLPSGVDKQFVYPRSTRGAGIAAENGGGDPATARDDGARPAGEPLVRAVYGGQATGPDGRPLPGHGFAFLLQRARPGGVPRDGLYQVTIHLFKGFEPWEPTGGAESKAPVAIYTTELMAGPMKVGP